MSNPQKSTTVRVEAIGDGLGIHDWQRGTTFVLNATTCLVWQHCDGRTTPRQLAELLQRAFNVSHRQAEELLDLALAELDDANLLQRGEPLLPRPSRRQVIKGLTAAGLSVILMPVVSPVSTALAGPSPTTALPTTPSPTTRVPTTHAPTQAPTTRPPTTAPPTQAPTTRPPTTAPPTQAPTTRPPTTTPPTQAPTTRPPTTHAPTQAPTTRPPATTTTAPSTTTAAPPTTTTTAPTTTTTAGTEHDDRAAHDHHDHHRGTHGRHRDGTGDGAATPEAPAGLLLALGLAPLASLAAWRRRRQQRPRTDS